MNRLTPWVLLALFACKSQPAETVESPAPTKAVPVEAKGTDENIPANLDEALAALDKELSAEDKEKLESGERTPAELHHGFGTGLRNRWGLWRGSKLTTFFNSIGIFHPDDMSAIILDSYVRKLKGEPIRLREQVEHYKAYWAKMKMKKKK